MSSNESDTRTRILQAALALLESGDGNKVRMSDIANAAHVSRQAVYLHFANRADLLVAVTHYVDEIKRSDDRLHPSRTAPDGVSRLHAFISAWCAYIPEIQGVALALLAMAETDMEAESAWEQRMNDMHEGCAAAINALARDGRLNDEFTPQQAVDLLWAQLSIRNWQNLICNRGWSHQAYTNAQLRMAFRLFVKPV